MGAPVWTIVLAACILAAWSRILPAQQSSTDSTRTTVQGVYAADQAARGRETYEVQCLSCHPPATHTGAEFTTVWRGKPLWELFRYIRELMPKSDPGILSERETAQVLAYLLQLNGMPSGGAELPADSTALKRIRIDLGVRP